jgi:hypothetical protein
MRVSPSGLHEWFQRSSWSPAATKTAIAIADAFNVAAALAAVGGSFNDLNKLTLHFVEWSKDKLAVVVVCSGRKRVGGRRRSSSLLLRLASVPGGEEGGGKAARGRPYA